MKKIFSLLMMISAWMAAKAQQDEMLIDQMGQVTTDVAMASRFRKIDQQGHRFVVQEFDAQGKLLYMQAQCSRITPGLVFDGAVTFYFSNGQVKNSGHFKNGMPTGIHKTYYENGKPQSVKVYKDAIAGIAEYWNNDGNQVVEKGVGHIIENEGKSETHLLFKDSIQVASFQITASRDTVYLAMDSPPDYYDGGIENFYRHVKRDVRYPELARVQKVAGLVLVQLTIDKSGNPVDAIVLAGIGSGCDEAAELACKAQKKWKPAMHQGKPVNARVIVPVEFKL